MFVTDFEWLTNTYQEVIEIRTSVLSILIALTVIIAGPLAFAGQDQVEDQVTETTETIETTTEASEPSNISEVSDSLSAESTEDCTNNADDAAAEKIGCDEPDC